jgi:hypothetical protein
MEKATTSKDEGSLCSELYKLNIHVVFWKVVQVVSLMLEQNQVSNSGQGG